MATATAAKTPAEKPAPRAPKQEGRLVHAWRRTQDLDLAGKEKPVEVIACGEKILFKANEAGHMVALVVSDEAYTRLVKEIPEAYIPYKGGENLPERTPNADPPNPMTGKKWVLRSGDKALALDDLERDELIAFAERNCPEALPEGDALEAMDDDTVRTVILNTFTTG